MTCISTLGTVARQRPVHMSTVIQTFEILHGEKKKEVGRERGKEREREGEREGGKEREREGGEREDTNH